MCGMWVSVIKKINSGIKKTVPDIFLGRKKYEKENNRNICLYSVDCHSVTSGRMSK